MLFIIGTGLIGYANHIDSSENTEALMYGAFGVIFLVITVISELLRWIL